jgi:hypothetical protein
MQGRYSRCGGTTAVMFKNLLFIFINCSQHTAFSWQLLRGLPWLQRPLAQGWAFRESPPLVKESVVWSILT